MEHAITIHSSCQEETIAVGRAFAAVLRGGEIVLLEGELGAGKTFFVRAVARELGVREHVTSPTFVLQKSYAVRAQHVHRIVHYDLYRIGSYEELFEIGFEDLAEDAVAMVEWGDRFLGEYPRPVWRVHFDYEGEEGRRVALLLPDAASRGEFEKALAAQGMTFGQGSFAANDN